MILGNLRFCICVDPVWSSLSTAAEAAFCKQFQVVKNAGHSHELHLGMQLSQQSQKDGGAKEARGPIQSFLELET
jgi:hypothetical protein